MAPLHRKRGRPRRDEDAASVRKTLRVPIALWQAIEAMAEEEGVSTHAWMRQALAEKAGVDESDSQR